MCCKKYQEIKEKNKICLNLQDFLPRWTHIHLSLAASTPASLGLGNGWMDFHHVSGTLCWIRLFISNSLLQCMKKLGKQLHSKLEKVPRSLLRCVFHRLYMRTGRGEARPAAFQAGRSHSLKKPKPNSCSVILLVRITYFALDNPFCHIFSVVSVTN